MTRPVSVILGASKGLGLAIAEIRKERGDFTVEIASTFATKQLGDRITIGCNLKNLDDVYSTVDRISKLPEIDRFYWVAGRMQRGNLGDEDISDLLEVTDVNFRNALPIVHAVWSRMIQASRRCEFVVVASSAGTKAKAGESLYVATKHAQVGLTRSLGLESSNTKLTVCLVLPGGMKTSMWEGFNVPELNDFSNPELVAHRIMDELTSSVDRYIELEIPRGLR